MMTGLHPELVKRIEMILAAMEALGHPMKVIQGVRTAEGQQVLYNQGRTVPGKIVTNCDGLIKKSNHQVGEDGYGHAADLAFQGSDPFSELHPWDCYGACAKAIGLKWGGQWKAFIDRPHVEWR
jgi:peptidoglycan L-alanyl-D-glutamate endopeptidase CwlK